MMNEDSVPFDVLEDFPDTGDLSDQTGSDTIDPAQKVRFTIKKVEPRVRKGDDEVTKLTANLNIRVAIGAEGTDGQGKYKNKNLFVELLTWANPEVYNSDWWKKQARFPYKSFVKAMGYDPANPPKVTDELCKEWVGREFIGDIKKVPVTAATGETTAEGKKKYAPTGDFKNEVGNFKAIA